MKTIQRHVANFHYVKTRKNISLLNSELPVHNNLMVFKHCLKFSNNVFQGLSNLF